MIGDDVGLTLVEHWDEAEAFRAWLGERRSALAVDTETSGLRWWDGQLRLVQFGDTRAGWAIPWDEWRALIRDTFTEYRGPLVFHNAKFDLSWLETNGCAPARHEVNDTAVMGHLTNPHGRTALKTMAAQYVDYRAAEGQDELKKAMARAKWTWGSIPVEYKGYWVYSALDVVLTAHLYEKLWPQVQTSYRRVYDLEMAVLIPILEMERRGVRADFAYCEEKRAELLAYAAEARAWTEAEYDCPAGSTKRLAAVLLKEGVPLSVKTPGGAWSMAADVLETIDHPLAQTVIKIRTAEKMANSYFANFTELADADGFVHPSVRLLGAKTGRMSVTDPALQTLPRGRLVRDAFIPRDGHTMLGVDYEQVEMRLLAHLSGDQALVDAFMSGEDFFTAMARRIYDDGAITKDDPRRQVTKSSMYAKVYGSGVAKFAVTAGIPVDDARTFMAQLDGAFPGMRRYAQAIQSEAVANRVKTGQTYVTTAMGRKEVADEGKEWKLVNAMIQGTAADLLKQVIVELAATDAGQYLVMPVHDELIFDVPNEHLEEVQQIVVETMARDEYAVPLTVDPHTGDRWGALK